MDQNVENSKKKTARHRGSRHLRVGILIQARTARVESMWVVEQPAVQAASLVDPVLARIDVAGRPVLVQAFPDPRISRGTFRKGLGHSFGIAESGIVSVSVPFSDVRQLIEVRIRVMDAAKARGSAVDPEAVAALFDNPSESRPIVADINSASLRVHPDWLKVAATLGLTAEAGRFEIFLDPAGGYRWRLKRPGCDVVAERARAHATREACEAEVRWIRTQAASLEVIPADAPGGRCEA